MNEWNVGIRCLDGVIIDGGRERYVQNIPFGTLAIGGYKELDRLTEDKRLKPIINGSKPWLSFVLGRQITRRLLLCLIYL